MNINIYEVILKFKTILLEILMRAKRCNITILKLSLTYSGYIMYDSN